MNTVLYTYFESMWFKFSEWFDTNIQGCGLLKPREEIPWYQYEYLLPGGHKVFGPEFKIPNTSGSNGGFSELLDSSMLEMAQDELKRIQCGYGSDSFTIRTETGAPLVVPSSARNTTSVLLKRKYPPPNYGPM